MFVAFLLLYNEIATVPEKSWNLLIFEKFWDLRFKNPKDLKSLFTLDLVCGGPLDFCWVLGKLNAYVCMYFMEILP